MLPPTVTAGNAPPLACVRCGIPPLVRHLEIGWLCCDHAVELGYPLAIQLKAEQALVAGLALLYPIGMPRSVANYCKSRVMSIVSEGVRHAETA